MSTVSKPPPPACPDEPLWRTCAGCTLLFPATPDQDRCPACACEPPPVRCQAAHPDDRSPCDGPADAVRVVDQAGGHAHGCLRHAPVMLAALVGGRVYPAAVPGAAVEVFHRAAQLRPTRAAGRSGGGR